MESIVSPAFVWSSPKNWLNFHFLSAQTQGIELYPDFMGGQLWANLDYMWDRGIISYCY